VRALHPPPETGDGAERLASGVRMTSAAEFAAWLGESIGPRDLALPAHAVKCLKKAFEDKILDEDDIAEDESLDGGELKEAVELWRDFYVDGAKAAKVDSRASDARKLARWLTARWSAEPSLDGMDDTKPSHGALLPSWAAYALQLAICPGVLRHSLPRRCIAGWNSLPPATKLSSRTQLSRSIAGSRISGTDTI
jgi:hypothetical protein